MLKKAIACCSSLGAALVMLVGIPFGNAVGNATDAAIRVSAQQPALDAIIESLEISLRNLQIPLIVAFVAAIILLIVSKVCQASLCSKSRKSSTGKAYCIFTSVSMAIALLGSIGTIIASGTIAISVQSVLVLQPTMVDTFNEIAALGYSSALLATVFAAIIAAGILICMLCSCICPLHLLDCIDRPSCRRD